MPRATANEIELEYETFGDRDDPPLLLVMGLGAQMISWDEDFCEALAGRGFYVIRFDNRDVGLSTKIDAPDIDVIATVVDAMGGGKVEAPYLLGDMAADAWGLLDALSIDRAHLVGASLGGMIVQTMAIQHPTRVLSLTSIMSNTGDFSYGAPKPEVALLLVEPAPSERETNIERAVTDSRLIGSPEYFDEDRARARAGRAFDRCFYPRGVGHQLLAAMASGSRDEALRELDVPTLVLHGTEDPLITPSGGEHTAECIPGSELVLLEGMGHDLPVPFWSQVINAICVVAARAVSTSEA
jgi:pimeloyl-ACP methyl ester carboxylesterase